MHFPTLPDKSLFVANRARLAAALPRGGMAVLNANDVLPSNADGHVTYKPASDLFWASGIQQEETLLVLFPDSPDEAAREVLFLRETSEEIARWDGHKHTKEEARAMSGINNVQWTKDFWATFRRLATDAETILLNTNEHKRADVEVESRDARFIAECKARFPLHAYARLAPLLGRLRAIKQPAEVEMMRRAIELTDAAFRRSLKFIKPGRNERELQAEIIHEYIRQGGGLADYDPILASGGNACILHYHDNNQDMRDGEIILMDVAAGYLNYNADMTRVAPINGRFTDRQKQVYNAVLRVMRAAIAMLRPGLIWKDWQKATEDLVARECVALGLLTQDEIVNTPEGALPAVKKYFMHGVGHFLGLNVHDVGYFHEPFAPGMVVTVEPGIYINDEGIGIRLENNVLITESGHQDLMAHVPVEAEEIERLMQG